jgi:hypothetical protein
MICRNGEYDRKVSRDFVTKLEKKLTHGRCLCLLEGTTQRVISNFFSAYKKALTTLSRLDNFGWFKSDFNLLP